MKSTDIHSFQVAVVGGGVGGVSASLGAARAGAKTILIEKASQVGGTGVHSPVGLVCTYCDASGRPINRGVHAEYVPYIYRPNGPTYCQTYDEHQLLERYESLLRAEKNITVLTDTAVTGVEKDGQRILSIATPAGNISADVFIDSTAEGFLAAAAGAPIEKGRPQDGIMQPATLTFRVDNVDFTKFGVDTRDPEWLTWPRIKKDIWDQLQPYYSELKAQNRTRNPRDSILCFPDRFGTTLLFNQTCIRNVDSTSEASVAEARIEGEKQVREFWSAVGAHPAFESSGSIQISSRLGLREGRRIIGDYILTAEDCLNEARFDDMIAACGYFIDVHDPETGHAELVPIPGSGYYHIPYRCLIPKKFENLLLGSRCISGTHEAHGSYRVMSSVSAIGQAAGVAGALSVRFGGDVRNTRAEWIRHQLDLQDQFTEGPTCPAPDSIEEMTR
ncbi:MAG: FAD-dependent oxidoreductase [Kiritimatiellae bacterium]|jgi:hypothetical protein|nr:FAD-dependent oxidoreductase [Kiritimatiellia bacterium]